MNALEIIQQASTILGFPMPITLEYEEAEEERDNG